jgi:hypothetical protein
LKWKWTMQTLLGHTSLYFHEWRHVPIEKPSHPDCKNQNSSILVSVWP